MVKKYLFVFVIAVFSFSSSQAQHEFGLSLGASNAYTDLGGANDIGRPLFWDFELKATRPVLGAMYRYTINPYVSVRGNFYWARLSGDDKFISDPGSPTSTHQWFRHYRNLNFKTNIFELSAMAEVNFMRFEVGRYRYRFTPYATAGIGLFYFNPKSKDGTKLRPLGTEGQNSSAYPTREPYSLIQPAIPFGLGIKYNIDQQWTIGFEYVHRLTFTDYLDDVSKTYVEPEHLSDKGAALARRSDEIDPGGEYSHVTAPGQQRGDPTDYDSYVFAGVVTITYKIGQGRIYCPKF
jgi:opacity protein-like surface antigen